MKRLKKSHDYPPKDNIKLKEMIKQVYEQKTYYEPEDEDDDDDEEDEEKEKKHKKTKKHRGGRKKRDSSDESPKRDSSEEKPKPEKPSRHKEKVPEKPRVEEKPKSSLVDILDFDSPVKESAPAPTTVPVPAPAPVQETSWEDFNAPPNTTQAAPKPPAPSVQHPPTSNFDPLAGINLNPSPFSNPNSYPSGPVRIYLL